MSYPDRPHIRFPFTRVGGELSLDALGAADPPGDQYDAGQLDLPVPDTIDAGLAYVIDPRAGQVDVVEQDTVEHVMSCELVIVHCPVGYRDDRPEFGWAWPELATAPLNLGPLEQALKQFEPRGNADATQYLDQVGDLVVNVAVRIASDRELEP
jgi:phage baseplate assembly protein W